MFKSVVKPAIHTCCICTYATWCLVGRGQLLEVQPVTRQGAAQVCDNARLALTCTFANMHCIYALGWPRTIIGRVEPVGRQGAAQVCDNARLALTCTFATMHCIYALGWPRTIIGRVAPVDGQGAAQVCDNARPALTCTFANMHCIYARLARPAYSKASQQRGLCCKKASV